MKKATATTSALLYLIPPQSTPKRYDIVKYSTWRMRLYQELESVTTDHLLKKKKSSLNQIFPKLCNTQEELQFFQDFLMNTSKTHQEELLSYFVCRMLYSRDLKNHDVFAKVQKIILVMRIDRIGALENDSGKIDKMRILKNLMAEMMQLDSADELNVSRQQFIKHQGKITRWFDSNRRQLNEHLFAKVPFEYGEPALRKRRSFVLKGNVYADLESTVDIVLNLYVTFTKQKMTVIRNKTEKLLEQDIENQLKPFMDKAINSISSATIDESELNSEFRLSLKNIDSVSKKFFPPCMFHLNQKLKQNGHLRHDGRRQLWLFFKGCGMNVNDNKEYFRKHMQLKVSNSDMKNHMYSIQHAYGLVGKKEEERGKMCRGIITGADPKSGEHHGCPFKHWGVDKLEEFITLNYGTSKEDLKEIIDMKKENYFQVACGRLFEAKNKPSKGNLPEQITKQLGKSPHQFFIAGMQAVEWNATKTLKSQNKKGNHLTQQPDNVEKMELEF